MDQKPNKNPQPPVNLRIKFRSDNLNQFIDRYSMDVSRGGIFIRTREPLTVGTPLKLDFQFQTGTPLISGDGTVVWIREFDAKRANVPSGMGVRFDRLTQESQLVLDQLLSEKAKRDGAPTVGAPVGVGIGAARATAGVAGPGLPDAAIRRPVSQEMPVPVAPPVELGGAAAPTPMVMPAVPARPVVPMPTATTTTDTTGSIGTAPTAATAVASVAAATIAPAASTAPAAPTTTLLGVRATAPFAFPDAADDPSSDDLDEEPTQIAPGLPSFLTGGAESEKTATRLPGMAMAASAAAPRPAAGPAEGRQGVAVAVDPIADRGGADLSAVAGPGHSSTHETGEVTGSPAPSKMSEVTLTSTSTGAANFPSSTPPAVADALEPSLSAMFAAKPKPSEPPEATASSSQNQTLVDPLIEVATGSAIETPVGVAPGGAPGIALGVVPGGPGDQAVGASASSPVMAVGATATNASTPAVARPVNAPKKARQAPQAGKADVPPPPSEAHAKVRRLPAPLILFTVVALAASAFFIVRFFRSQATESLYPKQQSAAFESPGEPPPTVGPAAPNLPSAAGSAEQPPPVLPSEPVAAVANDSPATPTPSEGAPSDSQPAPTPPAQPPTVTPPAAAPPAPGAIAAAAAGDPDPTDTTTSGKTDDTEPQKTAHAKRKPIRVARSADVKVARGALAAPIAAGAGGVDAESGSGSATANTGARADDSADAPPATTGAIIYELKVTSKPSGGDVSLDGQVVGKTPYSGNLPEVASPHFVTVRKDGFELFEQMIGAASSWVKVKTTKGGGSVQQLKLNAKLKPLSTTAPASSDVGDTNGGSAAAGTDRPAGEAGPKVDGVEKVEDNNRLPHPDVKGPNEGPQ